MRSAECSEKERELVQSLREEMERAREVLAGTERLRAQLSVEGGVGRADAKRPRGDGAGGSGGRGVREVAEVMQELRVRSPLPHLTSTPMSHSRHLF